jgi:hypothetical protein
MPSVAAGIAALATGFAVEAGWLQGFVPAAPKAAHSGVTILVKIPPGRVGPPTVERASGAARRDVRVASLDTDAAFDVADDPQPPSRGLAASFDQRFRFNTGASFGDRFAGAPFDVATAAPADVATAAPRSSPAPAAPRGNAATAIAKAIDEPPRNTHNERLALADPSDDAGPGHASSHLGLRHAAISPSAPTDSAKGGTGAKDESRPEGDDRIAIYDITAHTVYLPDGRRLEAHSGRGSHMDDPRAVNIRGQGPTPPNVYELSLRGQIFHGVRAIRLTPVGEARMYGRDGMLAHTYMLGRNGASMGCVSFSDYPAFLNAYLKGEVNRLVVVEHLASAPNPKTASDWLPASVKSMLTRS